MNHPETVYPVIIDPSVNAVSSATNIEDTYVRETYPNTNYYLDNHLKIGNYNGTNFNSGVCVTILKFSTLPTIPYGNHILSANLVMTLLSGQQTAQLGMARPLPPPHGRQPV